MDSPEKRKEILQLFHSMEEWTQFCTDLSEKSRSCLVHLHKLQDAMYELTQIFQVFKSFQQEKEAQETEPSLITGFRIYMKFLMDNQMLFDSIHKQVENQWINPLQSFIQTSQSIKLKKYEKSCDEYEQTMLKYLSQKKREHKKMTENALSLLQTKLIMDQAGFLMEAQLKEFHSKKQYFLLDKMSTMLNSFQEENLLNHEFEELISSFQQELPNELDSTLNLENNLSATNLQSSGKEILQFKQDFGLLETSEKTFSDDSVNEQFSKGYKKGFLWKKSHKGPVRVWQRFYFWTQPNDGLLLYYPKPKTYDQPSILADCNLCSFQETEIDDRSFVFEISSPQGVILLQAENARELNEWLLTFMAIKSKVRSQAGSPQIAPRMLSNKKQNDELPPIPPRQSSSNSPSQKRKAVVYKTGASQESQEFSSNNSLSSTDSSNPQLSLPDTATQPQHSPTDILHIGYLSLKEMKPSRRPSAQNREFSNVVWRFTQFFLQRDGRFYQQNDSQSSSSKIDVLNVANDVANRHYIQPVDESLFNRKFVFSIQTGDKTFFFAASSELERTNWLMTLKSTTKGVITGADGQPFRAYRTLNLRIIEGREFSASADAYCEIYFGSDLKAKSNSKKSQNGEPFWREDFYFEDLPSIRNGITIYVMNHNKLSKDSELGKVILPPNSLKPGEIEAWFPILTSNETSGISMGSLLSNVTGSTVSDHYGDLKLKVKFEEEVVLTLEQYKEMFTLFKRPQQNFLAYDLAQVSSDLEFIAQLLLNVYDAQGVAIPWLKFLLNEEVNKTDNMFVLFRGNSILTKAMDCFMKACGMEYLESAIGEIVREICEKNVYCEVDPTRYEKNDDPKQHWKKLINYSNLLWSSIERSKTKIPREMRILFHHLQRIVLKKFNQDREDKYTIVRYTSVSGFLFLRLFCPAILNPKLFGLTRDFPEAKASRTLTLLAKTLQCLANLANFGVKEPYMIEMNVFIMEHSNHLMEFIDNISAFPSNTTPLLPRNIDLEKQFSTLHRFIRNHLLQFEKLAKQHHLEADKLQSQPSSSMKSTSSAEIGASAETLTEDKSTLNKSQSDGQISTLLSNAQKSENLLQRSKTLSRLIEVSNIIEDRIHGKISI